MPDDLFVEAYDTWNFTNLVHPSQAIHHRYSALVFDEIDKDSCSESGLSGSSSQGTDFGSLEGRGAAVHFGSYHQDAMDNA